MIMNDIYCCRIIFGDIQSECYSLHQAEMSENTNLKCLFRCGNLFLCKCKTVPLKTMKYASKKSTNVQNGPEDSLEHLSEVHKNHNQGSVSHGVLPLALKSSYHWSVPSKTQISVSSLLLPNSNIPLAILDFIINYPGFNLLPESDMKIFRKIMFLSELSTE